MVTHEYVWHTNKFAHNTKTFATRTGLVLLRFTTLCGGRKIQTPTTAGCERFRVGI